MLEWESMLATPHRMNLNARHRLRRVCVHVNRSFIFFGRDRSKPPCRLEVLKRTLALLNSTNEQLQMYWNDLKDTPLRVANEVGHAWGVRIGCRLRHST